MRELPRTYLAAVAFGLAALVCLAPGAGARPLHPKTTESLPNPERGALVTLPEILAHADRHSPVLSVARVNTARGEAEVTAARPRFLHNPELRAGTGRRDRGGSVGVDVLLSLEQRFEIAGERGLRIHAAERLRDVFFLELEEVRWLVHRQVHATFHAGLVARERVAAATKLLEFTERMLEIAKRRHAAGDISALDVRVAETELLQARQANIAAYASFRAARLLLAELAGWPIETPPEPAGSLGAPRRAPAPERLLELAQNTNPKLRTLAQAVHAEEARRKLARAEAWPEPTLGISYARESGSAGEGREHIALLHLGLPLPVWQRNQGDRARADTQAVSARAERAALEGKLGAQVTRMTHAVNAAADRVAAYGAEIIPGFERNLELLRRSFELGEMDLLLLMVARGRFLEIERDALNAYADYYEAVARLEELVGADLWPDEHREKPPRAGEPR